MRSHDFYVWMAYGMTAIALIAEIIALRIRRARSLARVEEERELEAQD
jgi:heme exporter protein CcmD